MFSPTVLPKLPLFAKGWETPFNENTMFSDFFGDLTPRNTARPKAKWTPFMGTAIKQSKPDFFTRTH
ncbi:MAG: hypothetical protein K2X01_06780 [Cyanobacteria bacterium]|nr:hypothetical protein [Cyanobacteriota bacterium]